jgi:hypothetical protein
VGARDRPASRYLPALAWVLESTCVFDISVGNWTAAREAFTEGLAITQRLGDQRRWGELAAQLAQVLYHQGEFDRLAEWSAEMSAMASRADDDQRKAHALLADVWVWLPQGRLDAAVTQLQAVTELLAGRGSRADEILTDGLLALACLRRHDNERARLAAQRAARLIAQSQPFAVHILEGYASVAEVYLTLWEAGDHAAARPARQACAALRQYARAFQLPGHAHGYGRAWAPTSPATIDVALRPGARAWPRPNAWRCPANRVGRTTSSAGICPRAIHPDWHI